jgi:hypothetical protein
MVYARTDDGRQIGRICIVTNVQDGKIEARSITTQEILIFQRRNQSNIFMEQSGWLRLLGVPPAPAEVLSAFHELDRRYRGMTSLEEARLTQDERLAIRWIYAHYATARSDD